VLLHAFRAGAPVPAEVHVLPGDGQNVNGFSKPFWLPPGII